MEEERLNCYRKKEEWKINTERRAQGVERRAGDSKC